MKMLRLIFLVFLHLAVLETGKACSCLPRTTQEALSHSDTVFHGELVAHEGNSAVFRVHEYWKGNLKGPAKLEWRRGDRGDCNGFWPNDLKLGSELLVFATKGIDGVYRTSICLPTKRAANADKAVHDLGPGKPIG
jgi:hypothetical protein